MMKRVIPCVQEMPRLFARSIACGLSIAGVLLLAHPGLAQQTSTQLQPLPGLGGSDSTNGAFSADGLNMYDLFHQLSTGPLPSMSDFRQEQQQHINSAAEDFRTRQMQRLQQQNQAQPTSVSPSTSMQQPLPVQGQGN
ncbi:MAG TPA: hypothetical protein V6D10_05410 [Trichocoleus sp.]|jgi:hypothetical protein